MKREGIPIPVSSDQLEVSSVDVRNRSGLTTRNACKQRHCSLLTANCSLDWLTVHCLLSRFLFIFSLLIFNGSLLAGLDFSFRPKGFVSIPLGEANEFEGSAVYSTGGGGELGFEIDLSTVWPNALGLGYNFGVEGAVLINPLQIGKAENVSFYSIGGVLGLYYFPFSWLFTRIDGALGASVSARDEVKSDPGLFWRGGGEIGFRFTPGFTLAANAGWRAFYSGGNVLNTGMYAGLTAQITFQTGNRGASEGINTRFDQGEPLYPVFMELYQNNPIGSVLVRNGENAEIRDVRLFFRAGNYTASEFPCGTAGVIPRGRSVELPLLADFSADILRFTDTGRVMGELVIRYRFLGQEREAVRAVTVAAYNRNAVPLGDPAAFAVFVSPISPEVLDFARFAAGLDRASRRTGHNANMQYAIWLLEGLRASGIRLGETYATENEVRYPAETLSHRTGTSRDLCLLYAAALEAVGIGSAYIKTEGDFLAAVNLGIGRNAAETLFNGVDKILIVDEEVWLPLSMTAFNDGFTAAWTQGAAVLNQTVAEDGQADFVIVRDAWASYPPAPLPELGRTAIRTDNAAATNAVNLALTQYIESEILPLVRQVSSEQGAVSSGILQNRLGILYTRAGRIADGKAAYERAAGLGSVPAMTNRGNLALAENDKAAAERWFRQALQRDPENRAALRGLEQLNSEK